MNTIEDDVRTIILIDKQASATLEYTKLFSTASYNNDPFHPDYLDMRYKIFLDVNHQMSAVAIIDNTVTTYRGQPWTKGVGDEDQQRILTFEGRKWEIANNSDGFPIRNIGINGDTPSTGPWTSDVFGIVSGSGGGGGTVLSGNGTIAPDNAVTTSGTAGEWTSVHLPWKSDHDTTHNNDLYYKREQDSATTNSVRTIAIGTPIIRHIDECIPIGMEVTYGPVSGPSRPIITNKPWLVTVGLGDPIDEGIYVLDYVIQYFYYDI